MKNEIKGYPVASGYIGFVNGKKMLFPTEDEYIEKMKETYESDDTEEVEK